MKSTTNPSRPRVSPLVLALSVITMLSLGMGVWMYTDVQNKANEIASLQTQNAQLREHANATLYVMEPSSLAPAALRGEVYLTISRSGVIALSGLPSAGSNEVYVVWLINDSDGTSTAAGTISANDTGQGFALLPADSAPYNRIAVSLETAGTTVPAGGYLLETEVLPGRG